MSANDSRRGTEKARRKANAGRSAETDRKKKKYENDEDLSDIESEDNEDIQAEEEADEDFDPIAYLNALIDLCHDIQKTYDRTRGIKRTNRESPIISTLKKYGKLAEDMDATLDDFLPDFYNVYRKYRANILDDDDSWLIDNHIIIEFGSDVKKTDRSRARNRRVIYLSTFYMMTADMFDDNKDKPAKADGTYSKFLLYPTKFIRYLYLIFSEIPEISGKDLDKLGIYLDRADDQLGITDRQYIEDIGMSGGLFGGNFSDGIGKIFSMVLKSAAGNGMNVEDMDGAGLEKITSIITELFNGEDFFSDIASKLGKCTDNKEIVAVLLEKVNNPELFSKIEEATGQKIDPEKIKEAMRTDDMADKIGSIVTQVKESRGVVTEVTDKEMCSKKEMEIGKEMEQWDLEKNNSEKEIVNNKMSEEGNIPTDSLVKPRVTEFKEG